MRVAALTATSSWPSGLDLEAAGGLDAARKTKGSRNGGVQRALPFRPMTLSFRDVAYSVPYPKARCLQTPASLAMYCTAACAAHAAGQAIRPSTGSRRLTLPAALPLLWMQGTAPPAADGDSSTGPHANQLLLLKGVSGAFRPGVLHALMVGSCRAAGVPACVDLSAREPLS